MPVVLNSCLILYIIPLHKYKLNLLNILLAYISSLSHFHTFTMYLDMNIKLNSVLNNNFGFFPNFCNYNTFKEILP
jgi:hypothetical protein